MGGKTIGTGNLGFGRVGSGLSTVSGTFDAFRADGGNAPAAERILGSVLHSALCKGANGPGGRRRSFCRAFSGVMTATEIRYG